MYETNTYHRVFLSKLLLIYEWGSKQYQNYLLEGGPLLVQTSPLHECSRKPSVSVCQLVLLWEAAFSFSEFFLLNSFNVFAHFMMGDSQVHLSTLHWVVCSFRPKTAWPPCPTLPIHLISPRATISCFSRWKTSSKGRKKWNKQTKKMSDTLKGIKIDESKNFFMQGKKNVLIGALHQMESTLKVTEV